MMSSTAFQSQNTVSANLKVSRYCLLTLHGRGVTLVGASNKHFACGSDKNVAKSLMEAELQTAF